jgi:hypothetical protein
MYSKKGKSIIEHSPFQNRSRLLYKIDEELFEDYREYKLTGCSLDLKNKKLNLIIEEDDD